jgi:ElaB/YqjD/DUF883 family membrane-anchored ribosome-binding protein
MAIASVRNDANNGLEATLSPAKKRIVSWIQDTSAYTASKRNQRHQQVQPVHALERGTVLPYARTITPPTDAACSLASNRRGTTAVTAEWRLIMADDTKTPGQIAEDAKQTGLAASQALSSLAADAKGVGRDAATIVKAVASDAKSLAGDAINTAKDSASATAKQTLDGLKAKAADVQAAGARYVSEEPGKALVVAFLGGVLIGALLTRATPSRSYY